MRRFISGFAILFCAWPVAAQQPDEAARFFEMRIRPLFQEKCAGCHSDEKRTSGLSLENHKGFAGGGNRGTVAIAGKPEESRIIQAVEQSGALKMPPGAKLRAEQIEDLRSWVRAGMRGRKLRCRPPEQRQKATIGRSKLRHARHSLPSAMPRGRAIRSTGSCSRVSKKKASRLRPKPIVRRCSAG
jgi:mono/diheme cytochrome c family protein